MKDKNWFNDNVTISRFPLPMEIIKSDWDIIINVSCEHIKYNSDACIKSNKEYYWFPLNEHSKPDMGLNSIYGAMMILLDAQVDNKNVLIHCHAGVNRSQTIGDCIYYILFNEHRPVRKLSFDDRMTISQIFGDKKPYDSPHVLTFNCERGMLPRLRKMELFLDNIRNTYQVREQLNRAGMLDEAKTFTE
jgi:hypothetical protein